MGHLYTADNIVQVPIIEPFKKDLREAHTGCTCEAMEAHEYYDGTYYFHQPECPWLMHGRKRMKRDRLIYQTNA